MFATVSVFVGLTQLINRRLKSGVAKVKWWSIFQVSKSLPRFAPSRPSGRQGPSSRSSRNLAVPRLPDSSCCSLPTTDGYLLGFCRVEAPHAEHLHAVFVHIKGDSAVGLSGGRNRSQRKKKTLLQNSQSSLSHRTGCWRHFPLLLFLVTVRSASPLLTGSDLPGRGRTDRR